MITQLVARAWNRLDLWLRPQLEQYRQARALGGLKQGRDVVIGRDPEIYSPQYIELGDRVRIGHSVRLQAIAAHNDQKFSPRIVIGAGSSLENNCTITCNQRVELGADVMVAGNVFVSDHQHQYQNPDQPVRAQDLTTGGAVVIGSGSHIGQNVCIFGQVNVGEHCVIGANSVVTHDIPSFSVAVGVPARVVRRYNAEAGEWQRVK